ncbi:MAG: peptidoglycan DD-metalloendopeptidase family protein [Candidatus Thermoplasmatota archaeon]|nr:peptidoglycan DD-metalloendopeptidase family protein [Candidatus Thermoplasmatota archaeon]
MAGIDFGKEHWYPTVDLPDEYEVRDFTTGDTSPSKFEFDIGRYDEVRPGMYNTELFTESRCIHVGLDIGGPIGTPVKSVADGVVAFSGYNPADGDYGHTVIVHHLIQGQDLWVLYGHLDAASTENCKPGMSVNGGEVIAWFGAEDENGGWPPHLHFQLSYREPTTHDLPGVVTPSEREQALLDFPDPRLVLGPLY